MNERVSSAMEALDQAKECLAKAKSTAGIEAKEDAMTVSDEEPDKDLAGSTADRIKEGLTNLQTSLEALQTSAEQMVEDEQRHSNGLASTQHIRKSQNHPNRMVVLRGLARPSEYSDGIYCSEAFLTCGQCLRMHPKVDAWSSSRTKFCI